MDYDVPAIDRRRPSNEPALNRQAKVLPALETHLIHRSPKYR
jgi:hypothetical protein